MSRLSWAKIARREVLSEGVKKDPTVGRRKNLLWVGRPTYRGSQRRPTVGFFAPSQSPHDKRSGAGSAKMP